MAIEGGKPHCDESFFHKGDIASSLLAFIACCCLLFVGCGSIPAPVSSRTPPPSQKINYHIVGQGDTLFAIAWRYELSVESLARANALSRPYNINIGQRLSLDMGRVRYASEKSTQRKALPVTTKKSRPPARAARAENRQPVVSKIKVYDLPKGQWHWQWPVKGVVSRHYDNNRTFKGLNVQSKPGRVVGAAAPGVVVYAGRGLRGYGQLLIIKHSETYLSAYAHNRRMYVSEGQRVKAGEKISEVGGDPENNGRLYFEIRKNGKPVDPIRLLPRL